MQTQLNPTACLLIAGAVLSGTPSVSWADDISVGQTVHLFHSVKGIKSTDTTDATEYCAYPNTDIVVTDVDSAGNVKFYVDKSPSNPDVNSIGRGCTALADQSYTISKSTLTSSKIETQGWVIGVLAVPYKFHLNDQASTAGTTVGGYVGYKTDVFNQFSLTPILAGGVALISTQPAQVSATSTPSTSASQTNAGGTLAGGFVATVGNTNSQIGLIIGSDWLGHKANYQYEGKAWIAFEVGYNFLTTK